MAARVVVEVQLQNCVVRCVLRVIGCEMSDACHAEREYPQDGGRGKKADGLYTKLNSCVIPSRFKSECTEGCCKKQIIINKITTNKPTSQLLISKVLFDGLKIGPVTGMSQCKVKFVKDCGVFL